VATEWDPAATRPAVTPLAPSGDAGCGALLDP